MGVDFFCVQARTKGLLWQSAERTLLFTLRSANLHPNQGTRNSKMMKWGQRGFTAFIVAWCCINWSIIISGYCPQLPTRGLSVERQGALMFFPNMTIGEYPFLNLILWQRRGNSQPQRCGIKSEAVDVGRAALFIIFFLSLLLHNAAYFSFSSSWSSRFWVNMKR